MNETKKRNNIFGFLIGASLGALAMYFLDPQRGHARRTLVRDKVYSVARKARRRAEQVAHNLKNRSLGAVKDLQSHLRAGESDDSILELRVRSSIGRKVSHARALRVSATNGNITLSGPILKREVARLISCVESVPGVRAVTDELSKFDRAGDIPSLQGKGAEYFQ